MTESLYLALFIWAVVYFNEFVRGAGKARQRSAIIICAHQMRLLPGGGVLDALRRVVSGGRDGSLPQFRLRSRRSVEDARSSGLRNFILLAAAAPVLWLAYNAIVYRNPLEFATRPLLGEGHRTEKLGTLLIPGPMTFPLRSAIF